MDKPVTPIIGKFVIENLTVGMYDDPRCVYREYIQNSADALDKAISMELLTSQEAAIHIQISKEKKSIEIEDNGTGISSSRIVPILQNVAQSEKEIGREKGFRGIGRLGGLGYCDRLVFETSFKGENVKSIMTWDAKRLKEIVNDRTKKEEAEHVITTVTGFHEEPESVEKHYFKVIMTGVTNAEILDEEEITDYLRMVAPVPFDSGFYYKSKIYEELKKENIKIDEYKVFVGTEQIYKGYTTTLYRSKNTHPFREKTGDILDLTFFKSYDKNGQLIFWGWHSISDIQGRQLDKSNKARGLRVRKDNIQIGDENRLESLFGSNPTDTRFNFYVVGEVYALHNQLIPNGRRDDFVDSYTYSEMKDKLKPTCLKIKKLANQTSDGLSAKRDIDNFAEEQKKYEEKQRQGFVNKEEQQKLIYELNTKKEKAEKGQKTIQRLKQQAEQEDNSTLFKVLDRVVKTDRLIETVLPEINDKPVYRTDKLSKLSKEQRKLVSRIYDIIKRTLDNERAELVIQKIEEEFK
ncbi:ATP-binding protein [Runella salmonicolor]|uniref:ATP-binding protein n=1 Tax=Runella salmonicolor TaxID=2950278 RepID=A0ABT1FPL0_9BACT|nr:ATP-binding protein [Runella salmonicolor]MCP1383684.1 ATP-binding protein [Runella salmonicolor]